jgi:hypothetical protein
LRFGQRKIEVKIKLNIDMKKIIGILLVLGSFGAYAQHDHSGHTGHGVQSTAPTFKDEAIGKAYASYIKLKDALVASDANEAKKTAAELEKALSSVPNGKKAQEAAKTIAASSEVTDQRASFSPLSNEMTTLIRTSKLTAGSLFVEYCPMANNNEGGFWLSNEREIKNPYFGDMMLKCGSVKETIQ